MTRIRSEWHRWSALCLATILLFCSILLASDDLIRLFVPSADLSGLQSVIADQDVPLAKSSAPARHLGNTGSLTVIALVLAAFLDYRTEKGRQ